MDAQSLETLAGQLLKIGAPILGGVIGGPAGALAPVIISAIADALGAAPTPEAVSAAIAADPAAAGAKVKEVEAAHGVAMKSAEQAYLDDVASARSMEVDLVKAGSPVQYGVIVVSILVTGVFAYALFTMLAGKGVENPSVNLIIGGAIAGYTQMLNYWLGSSKSSSDKNEQIAGMFKTIAGKGRR
jgi:hypothetical protein